MIIKQTLLQDPRDAEDAVKALDGTELCGMIAHVEMAKVVFFISFLEMWRWPRLLLSFISDFFTSIWNRRRRRGGGRPSRGC